MSNSARWLGVLGLLTVVGCGTPQAPSTAMGQAPPAAPAGPKRITIAIAANVPVLVERLSAGGVGIPGLGDVEKMISPGFSVVDDKGVRRGLLAEAVPTTENRLWQVLPDGRMETTWKIRSGVRWHDGEAFTADDVVFTARVDQDNELPMRRSAAYRSVASVDVVDAQTVTVRWKTPFTQADTLFSDPLFPRHVLERTYVENKASFPQHPYFLGDFIGTGSYRLQSFTLGSGMLLEANDQYVLGRPRIDEIEVKFIPEPATLMANVFANAVDLTLGRGVSIEQVQQAREHWSHGKPDVAFTSWLVIYPQFTNPNPAVVLELPFRQALMHALDRQQMADSLQAGLVSVAHTFLNPNERAYPEIQGSVVKYDYDPRRAAQLIEGLGYTKGPDSVYRDAGGQRLALEMRTSPEQDVQVKSLLVMGDYWQRIGVAADPVVMAEQQVRDREYVQSFPAFLMYRQPNDPDSLLQRLRSSETPLPENSFVGRNHPRYRNPEFDALIDRYYSTIPLADRTRVLGQVVAHTTERLTLMGLFYDVEPIFIANRLEGVAASKSTGSTPAWNVEQWNVRT